MRLRKILLLAVVVLVVSAIGLELAARSTAAQIARALSPRATLTYASAGVALDGSIRLRSPRLVLHEGLWQGVMLAREADLRGNGRFWLVAQTLSAEAGIPAELSLRVHGLRLEPKDSSAFWTGWLGTPDLAMFENMGCGDDALSDKDRSRMGVEPSERVDRFAYHHDRASGNLSLSMDLSSPQIATWKGYAEFSGFDPARWSNADVQQKLRLLRAGVSYIDPGYFSRRNVFCSQWLGTSFAQFVDSHVQATKAFLDARGIDPSADLVSLYERLVMRGGSLNLASLPDANWVPAEFEAYPRQVLLRQLNITARLDDEPPIMLRLAFSQPESPLRVARADASSVVGESVEPAGGIAPGAIAGGPLAVEALPVATASERETPASDVLGAAATPDAQAPAASAPTPAATESALADVRSPAESEGKIIASAPPPPADSTLALVWAPGVIERLPTPQAKARDYEVVALAGIRQHAGRRVQLVTEGGKQVDGIVDSVAGENLVLRVQVRRGSAMLNVPLSNIREVRLLHSR